MKSYLKQNISIIPIKRGQKTPNIKSWKEYQYGRIDLADYDDFFSNADVAMVCGKVSGNLECIDFDNLLKNASDIFSEFYNIEEVVDLIQKYDIPIQQTRSGGYHLIYKCDAEISGNQKLARQAHPETGKPITLIETRGEGGYFLVFPTSGYTPYNSSELGVIPIINKAERDLLISAAKSLNLYYEQPQRKNGGNTRKNVGERIGDTYNNSPNAIQDAISTLRNHGWTSSNDIHWTRPNKQRKSGISATFGKVDKGMLYVFSSNAHPFQEGQGYYPFAIKALLEFGGDYTACAKHLSASTNNGTAKSEILKAARLAANRGYSLSDNEITDLAIDHRISEEAIKGIISAEKIQISVKEFGKDTEKRGKKISMIEAEKYIDSKFDIRFNKILNIIEFKTKKSNEYSDVNVFDIMRQASSDGIEMSETIVNSVLGSTAIRIDYDPFIESFEALPKWDGEDHLSKLCSYIKLVDTTKHDFFVSMMKKAMMRTIKCGIVDWYYNRMVLVFISPKQEIGKSFFMRWLNPTNDRYYNESPLSDNKDALISYTNCLIYNIEELDNANKMSLSAIKGIISTQSVNVRVPYARQSSWIPRRCTFWATTNEKDFLEEKTNSRWICFDIEDIDKSYSNDVDKEQLWAQIFSAYNSGEDVELTDDEKDLRDDVNAIYVEETTEQAICKKIFVKDDSSWMSNADIYAAISEYTMLKNPTSRRVGKALKILNFHPKTFNNVRGWGLYINKQIKPF